MTTLRTCLLLFVALLATGWDCVAQSRIGDEVREQTFRSVWETVRDRYFDPSFGGLDWDEIRAEYQPRALGAESDAAFYDVLQEMVERLGQSHFRVMPPFWLSTKRLAERGSANAGITLVPAEERMLVWRIRPDTAREAPGLRAGCEILEAGEVRFDVLRREIETEQGMPAAARRLFREASANALTGAYGQQLAIRYQCGAEAPAQATVALRAGSGERSEQLGLMPSMETEFEVKRLEGDIVVIRFNLFVMSLLPRIRDAIQQAAADSAKGIIFDVRGNPGGIGAMANGIAGHLVAERASLGAMKLRNAELKFLAFPQDGAFLGPVAVLIDGNSASTSEIFAAGLQEMQRAIVVGERSMGAALPSFFVELPRGALLQYAVADFLTPNGVRIEGEGVKPDLPVALDAESLLAGRDAQLEAARAALSRQRSESGIVITGF